MTKIINVQELFPEAQLKSYTQINLKLGLPIDNNDERLNLWRDSLLKNYSWPSIADSHTKKLVNRHQVFSLQFYLEVVRFLFEAVKVPLFEPPKVNAIEGNSENAEGKLEVTISLRQFEQFPKAITVNTIRFSQHLFEYLIDNDPDTDGIERLFASVDKLLVSPLSNFVYGSTSAVPILKEAYRQDVPYEHVGAGVYSLGWGSRSIRLQASACHLDSALGTKLAQNKAITASLIRTAGLPAPEHFVVTTKRQAQLAVEKLQFPIVVKPLDRDRGEGVFVDISDEAQLYSAFAKCQKVAGSDQVILERQVHGVCHRFLVVNRKVIYVIRRDPISVIGDGKTSIADLVNEEVSKQRIKPPWERSPIKPIDTIAKDTLQKLGYNKESVPEEGARIPLRPIQSAQWGGSPQDVTEMTHDENLEIAVRSADLFNLYVVGVDIISPDISKPWHTNGAIINEVNFKPQIGSTISQAYIPQVLTQLIDGDGKIPIESFATEEAAKARQKHYCDRGYRCFLTAADMTIDFLGNQLVMPFNALRPRVRALICRSDVDAIVVCDPQ